MSSQKAIVLTWGCSHNQKDSQLIEFQLLNAGFKLVEETEDAEIVVFNTCTVKTPTENKIFHVLDGMKNTDKKVVVAGCITQSEPELIAQKYPNFIRLGVNAAKDIIAAITGKNGELIELDVISSNLGFKDNKSDWIEKPLMGSTQWNEYLNIIQINEGCLNSCSFCATKIARGHLRSYSAETIINSIRSLPTPEVWLTSQDTACWGFDFQQNLAHLINEIDTIDRKLWVRVGMGNPNNLIKVLPGVIEAYNSDKIYKFLHLPVQSGNNDVLKHMKRGYTVEEYELIVSEFRTQFPEITLSTDVICGYPTESEEDFQDTITTIKNTRPAITNISRFWERRGTPAANLKQLPHDIRKSRSSKLTKLCHQIQKEDNLEWLGWTGEIYFAEMGEKGGIQARNIFYKPIIVDVDHSMLGNWGEAEIVDATSTYLIGNLISS